MNRVVYVYLGLVFLLGILGFLDNIKVMLGLDFPYLLKIAAYSTLAILIFSVIILPFFRVLHLPWTFYMLPLYYFISTAILWIWGSKLEAWSLDGSIMIFSALSLFEVVYSFYLMYEVYEHKEKIS